MSEEEFCYWRDEREEFDALVAEAEEEAVARAKEAGKTQ